MTSCRSARPVAFLVGCAIAVTALAVTTIPASSAAQGTLADYKRSEGLRAAVTGLVVNAPEPATWIEHSNRFWYRRGVRGGNEFVMVDVADRRKRPAFDHEKLAATLSRVMGKPYTALTLPFTTFTYADSGRRIAVRFDSSAWSCSLADYACVKDTTAVAGRFGGPGAAGAANDKPRLSPDGKTEASVRNYNVAIRAVGATTDSLLSTDGSEGNAYRVQSIAWSPDSKHLAAFRVRPGYQRMVRYVESSPADQLQPKTFERFYAKPGDALDVPQPVLFDLAAHTESVLDASLFPNPYALTRLAWRKDNRAVTFEYNQRGHQVYRVLEADAATGAVRTVIDERMPTFVEYSAKIFRYDVDDGKEVVWMSERDGWNHLYLYDGVTGRVKNQITRGPWVVRGVDSVDVTKRQVWFRASGMDPKQDPYFVHYYRINFDGTGLTAFTQADGNHVVRFSPDHATYVDTWSRVDLAPVSQLRRTSDQSVIEELDRGDASALLATGWHAPEPFVAKGRDGVTDIWGVIIRPTNFDPAKRYPVIENIYAGPQDSFVPKSFAAFNAMQAVAELGFVVVQIDGMGTSNRSKAFHDVTWKNLGDAGFPDRILWHKAVAAKYPWYDISRVGIYGTSAGGQNSLGALLFHPEFYKAAFSAAGCHDNRMDKIWWNEQWMGWPIGPEYAAASNMVNASKLQGKLMLLVGELDTNVDPSSTMQVVNALIKADKFFDLLVIPGANHTSGGPYGDRKRNDFFVHNLLGVEPPDRNALPMPAARSGDDDEATSWDAVWAAWGGNEGN
ncbi:MAG: DPP IV N-terminal domain-containing protein [Proteobacteria bacterium]|nr:DPP IV N-terminal domain-containing protein [Pseudomonadota bacterium]